MDIESLRTLFGTLLSATLIPAMLVFALGDFLAGTVAAVRAGTFEITLWGKWAFEKGLTIASVSVLYAMAAASGYLQVEIEGVDLDAFSAIATLMAGTFIAAQVGSILKNLGAPPAPEDPVEEEAARTGTTPGSLPPG